MKTKLLVSAVIFGLYSHYAISQEFGAKILYNSAENPRLQNGYGIEISFTSNHFNKLLLEASVSSIRFKNHFQEGAYCPFLVGLSNIQSTVNKYSAKINIQWVLKNNEHVSLSIGPEAGYSKITGSEKVTGVRFVDLTSYSYSAEIDPRKDWVWGIISTIKLKEFPLKRTSVLFHVKASLFPEGVIVRGVDAPLQGSLYFVEFGIGFNYRITK